jgi:hypothetical protein
MDRGTIFGRSHRPIRKLDVKSLHAFYLYYTVCPQSPLGVLKNCGAQTCGRLHETLEVFLTPTDGINGHLYVSQSVICEMATVEERALCVGWLFEIKISHPDSTKLLHTVQ